MIDRSDDVEQPREYWREFRSYLYGLLLALALTLVPYGLVYWGALARLYLYVAIGVLALVQMVVHFRFFLHIGFNRKREDLLLILFSALLLSIMVAGTIWIMLSLSGRMSPGMF